MILLNNDHTKLLHNGEAFFSIAMVGFPGCGKSTIGKQLAKALHYDFCDLDTEFTQRYEISIHQFFKQYGEKMFRKCEYDLLTEMVEQPYKVISCGGGTPCFFNSMDLMLRECFTIYVKMSTKSLHQRLSDSKRIRPLTQNMTSEQLHEYIEKTLPLREQFYQRAHLTYKGEDFHIEELMNCLNNLPD